MTDAAQNVATVLKEARTTAGLSFEDVSAELNIRLRHLEAIEAGAFESLPPPAFTAGFVRSYATLLGLDGCALAQEIREQMGETGTASQLRFPEPVAESRLPGRSAILSGLVGLTAIYFGWIHDFSGATELARSTVEPVPERLAGLADGAGSASTETTHLQPAGFRPAADIEHNRPSERKRAPMGPPATSSRLQPADAGSPPVNSAGGVKAAITTPPTDARVLLSAETDSWIRIVDGNGRERFSGVLRAGESWMPEGAPGPQLQLTTSNAGGLNLVVDGERLAPLGKTGAFVENVTLEPERLKNEYTLAMH